MAAAEAAEISALGAGFFAGCFGAAFVALGDDLGAAAARQSGSSEWDASSLKIRDQLRYL